MPRSKLRVLAEESGASTADLKDADSEALGQHEGQRTREHRQPSGQQRQR